MASRVRFEPNSIVRTNRTHRTGGPLSLVDTIIDAKKRGIRRLVIADLDIFEGMEGATDMGRRLGVFVHPGVEISVVPSRETPEVRLFGFHLNPGGREVARLCLRNRETVGEGRFADIFETIRAIHADGGKAVYLPVAGTDPDVDGEVFRRFEEAGAVRMGATGSLDPPVMDDPDTLWLVELVRRAGDIALKGLLSTGDPRLKGGRITDLVTEHDEAVEKFLVDGIHERFPDHMVLGEEANSVPEDSGGSVWIVDPIDGTTNFVSSGSYFAVSVARYDGGRPVLGVVFDPIADNLYLAVAKKGAYLNGVRLPDRSVDGPRPLEECVLEVSVVTLARWERDFGGRIRGGGKGLRGLRAHGCASLGLCRIAGGTLDLYVSGTLSIWDYAAAAIVLTETGGAVAVERLSIPGENNRYHREQGFVLGAPDPATLESLLVRFFPDHRDRFEEIVRAGPPPPRY